MGRHLAQSSVRLDWTTLPGLTALPRKDPGLLQEIGGWYGWPACGGCRPYDGNNLLSVSWGVGGTDCHKTESRGEIKQPGLSLSIFLTHTRVVELAKPQRGFTEILDVYSSLSTNSRDS